MDMRGRRSSYSAHHKPPVCLECKELFLDIDGYFYMCAGKRGLHKIYSLVKPFFETRIRAHTNARAAVCAIMLNINRDLRLKTESSARDRKKGGRGQEVHESEEKQEVQVK